MNHQIEVLRELRKAGLRPDDAALAAEISVRKLRVLRDRLIVAARGLKYSMREIGELVGVDVAIVHRVLTRAIPSQQHSEGASASASSRE